MLSSSFQFWWCSFGLTCSCWMSCTRFTCDINGHNMRAFWSVSCGWSAWQHWSFTSKWAPRAFKNICQLSSNNSSNEVLKHLSSSSLNKRHWPPLRRPLCDINRSAFDNKWIISRSSGESRRCVRWRICMCQMKAWYHVWIHHLLFSHVFEIGQDRISIEYEEW